MAIVASGEIKISDINSEKGLSPTAANSSLASLSTSGINNDSPAKPDAIAPHAMSEFYNYDHTYAPSPTPSITPSITPSPLCYTSTVGPVSTVQASTALACAASVAITLYINGPETYTQPDCSVMATDGYYGDGSGGYYQVSGGAISGLQVCSSPATTPSPTPTSAGSLTARLAYTINDACADQGDPYYVNASCAASFTVGCKLYTNAGLTNSVDSGELTGVGPWYVYTTSTVGQYWNYQNNGGSWEATSGPFSCPSPSPTISLTPTPTPTPCYGSTVGPVSTVKASAALACAAPVAITLYVSGGGIETYTQPDCSVMATDGYYGDGSGGYYQVSGGAISSLQACISPTPTITPSNSVPGAFLRLAATEADACADNGDPYYANSSCAATISAGCRLYTNASLTNPANIAGWVYKPGEVGTYWRYENNGGTYEVTGSQQTCPSPTPSVTLTPSVSVTPDPTPTPTRTPSTTPSPTSPGVLQARFAATIGEVCADQGDPYYINNSCASSFTTGCKLYTNAALTNSFTGDGYVYTTSTVGQYWTYGNNGGSYEAILGPYTCPSPSVTPTITPSITPSESVSVTPSETATPSVTPSKTPSVTPSPTTPGAFLRLAATEADACVDNGDPYYTNSSCASTISAGCRLYTNAALTNPVNIAGWVYKPSAVGTYWRYENNGGTYEVTGTQQTCPSPTPSVTPSVTPSITPSETATPSVTPSITPSETATPSVTPSETATPSVTPSETATPSVTPSITPSVTPSITPSETATPSVTPSKTPSVTPSPTTPGAFLRLAATEADACVDGGDPYYANPTCAATISAGCRLYTNAGLTNPVNIAGWVYKPGAVGTYWRYENNGGTYEVTGTQQTCPSPTPSMTPSVTPSVTPSNTATPSVTPSITASTTPSISISATPSVTPSITPSITATPSVTASVTPSITPSITPSETTTPSVTPSKTPSVTPSPTTPGSLLRLAATTTDACIDNGDPYYANSSCAATITAGCRLYTNAGLTNPVNIAGWVYKPSAVGTYWRYENNGGTYEVTGTQQTCPSPTPSTTPSTTPSVTPSTTPSISVTPSITPTNTATPSVTPTITPSNTATPSVTPSITPTRTPSTTATPSVTPSITPSNTATPSVTPSVTPSITPTVTPSNTTTPSVTPSVTPSITPTVTPSNTTTPSVTPSVTRTPSVTPSPTSQGQRLDVSTSLTDVCNSNGDPIYFNASCSAALAIGCIGYTTASLTTNYNLGASGYVGYNTNNGQYWVYANNGGTYMVTSGPFTCPSPSPTPSVTPSTTPSISVTPSITPTRTPSTTPSPTPPVTPTPSVTPSPTPSAVTCYNLGSFEYVTGMNDCQVGNYPYQSYSDCFTLGINCYLYTNSNCSGSIASQYIQYANGDNVQTNVGGQVIDINNPGC